MLLILPKIFGENGIWITQFCVGAITLTGIVIYSRYLTKKSNSEYNGIYINKSHGDDYFEFTINGSSDEVDGLVSLIENKLANNKFSNSVCSSLDEFLKYVIETNDELKAIDVLLDVGEESVKIYVKDLGSERRGEFTFKNEVDCSRKLDYSWVIGLNSTLITID